MTDRHVKRSPCTNISRGDGVWVTRALPPPARPYPLGGWGVPVGPTFAATQRSRFDYIRRTKESRRTQREHL